MSFYCEFKFPLSQQKNIFGFFGHVYSGDLDPYSVASWLGKNWSNIDEVLNRQYGEFSFVAKHPTENVVVLARDALGVAPLYIYQDPRQESKNDWIVSSQLQTIIQRAGRLSSNTKYLKSIDRDDFSKTTETPYNEVSRCPPGHYATIQDSKIKFYRYWDFVHLQIPQKTCSLDEHITSGRKILTQIFSERLTSHSTISTFLSGGLDSSYISLTMDELQAQSRSRTPVKPLADFETLTVNFSNTFAKDKTALNDVLDLLRCSKNMFEFDLPFSNSPSVNLFDNQADLFADQEDSLKGAIFYDPCLWLFKPMLLYCKNKKIEIAITGLGGDDLFQPGLDYLSELSIFKHFIAVIKQLLSPQNEKFILSLVWQHIIKPRVPTFIYKKLKASFGDKNLKTNSLQARLRLRPMARTIAYRFMYGGTYAFSMEQEQELAQFFGVRMSYPYLDRRIVEYILATPPEYFLSPKLDKKILRLISQEILPPSVYARSSTQNYNLLRQTCLLRQKSGWAAKMPNFDWNSLQPEKKSEDSQTPFEYLLKAYYNSQCTQQSTQENP